MVAIFTEKVMAEEGAERLKNVEVLCQQGVLIPLPAEQEADVSIWGKCAECRMVVGEGFEPSKSVTADLQSAPFGRSGIPPGIMLA